MVEEEPLGQKTRAALAWGISGILAAGLLGWGAVELMPEDKKLADQETRDEILPFWNEQKTRISRLNELAAELALAKAAYDELKTNGHYRWHSESATFEPITASVLGQYATGRAAVECPAPNPNILERRSTD